jgi:hypothetical protein
MAWAAIPASASTSARIAFTSNWLLAAVDEVATGIEAWSGSRNASVGVIGLVFVESIDICYRQGIIQTQRFPERVFLIARGQA